MEWSQLPLELLCTEFTDGNWVESKDQSPQGIRLIQTGNVGEGLFKNRADKARFISESTFSELKCFEIFEGDCLISRLPDPVGRSCVLPNTGEKMITAVDCTVVRFDAEKLLPTFFNYYSQSKRYLDDVERHTSGATRKRISRKNLGKVKVPVPPIAEQKRIVAILDQAFTDIDKASALTVQNLKNARELFESTLQRVFSQRGDGWDEKGLNEISVEFGRGKSKHRPRNDKSLYGGKYPFIQTGDVRGCEHRITSFSKTYNEKGLAQSKLWPKDTICITIAANIAETGIMDFEGCFPDSVIGVVVDPQIATVRYVEYLLQSFRSFLQSKGQGAAQDNINLGTFENLKFPFPSLHKQQEIVASLDVLMSSVQQLEMIYSGKLTLVEELKQSALQKAFRGELTKDLVGVSP